MSGFFTSYRRFFKAIRHATVNVEVADSVRDMAEQTGAQIAVITGRDGTYMKELNEFIARADINPKSVSYTHLDVYKRQPLPLRG